MAKEKKKQDFGSVKVRGRSFVGTVLSTKMHKTAIVEWERRCFIPKYERYEKRRTKIKAHVPDSIKIKDGDIVKISECRPLSKTKNFIVTEKVGEEAGFKERMEALEEAKVKVKEKVEEEKDEGSQS